MAQELASRQTAQTLQAPTQRQKDALVSLLECSRRFLGSGERVTASQAEALPEALAANSWYQRPAGPMALAVQLDRLAAWAKSFNIPHDTQAMPMAYADLATLPVDLIEKAFTRAMSGSTDTFRLPLPSAIRAQISEEMARRHAVTSGLHKMELAVKRGDVERRVTGKQANPIFQKFEEQWASFKAGSAERERQGRKEGDRAEGMRPIYVANPMLDEIVERAKAGQKGEAA